MAALYEEPGRPRRLRDDFIQRFETIRIANGWSLRYIEDCAEVDHTTYAQLKDSRYDRSCSEEVRKKLTFLVERDGMPQQRKYLAAASPAFDHLILRDPEDPLEGPYLPAQQMRELLMRGLFDKAQLRFYEIWTAARSPNTAVHLADAAEIKSWLELERMNYEEAGIWIKTGLSLIETVVGTSVDLILRSVEAGSQSAEISMNSAVAKILSRLLHTESKIQTEQLVFGDFSEERRAQAARAFQRSLMLDYWRHNGEQLSHDFRWEARLLAYRGNERRRAVRRVGESLAVADQGSSFIALSARDRGFVYWQNERPHQAEQSLLQAIDMLIPQADARALGPAYDVLSRIASENGSSDRLKDARRYALLASVLHPYGYIRQNNARLMNLFGADEVRRDIDEILGAKNIFKYVRPALSHLATRAAEITEPYSADTLLERHLIRAVPHETDYIRKQLRIV